MCIGIFSFRAFDRRLARLAAPISSGVRQGGGQNLPPSGARSAEYPSGARVNEPVVASSSLAVIALLSAVDNSPTDPLFSMLVVKSDARRGVLITA